jgi:hypothetical protein
VQPWSPHYAHCPSPPPNEAVFPIVAHLNPAVVDVAAAVKAHFINVLLQAQLRNALPHKLCGILFDPLGYIQMTRSGKSETVLLNLTPPPVS